MYTLCSDLCSPLLLAPPIVAATHVGVYTHLRLCALKNGQAAVPWGGAV